MRASVSHSLCGLGGGGGMDKRIILVW
jgi:hypothetical protein